MAEGQTEHNTVCQFKSVLLLKEQSLGTGSYGAVCKAKCDYLICAAKIIHPTLFNPTTLQHTIAPHREHRLPIRRFEQECEFLSAIRHPNIVQYLGTVRDTDTHLPVLLMELMDDNLTHFLENSIQDIPYHIQINICHDVALALSFLHSNSIVHRDLSSNNILLRGNTLAKLTDFGMVRLGDINARTSNTKCPGTDVYMPPEAVQEKPTYTEKIDCFSFGVIIVQILTRQFPNPGDRLKRIELNHPGLSTGSVLVEVSEIDRRQNHISQVDPDHSLLPIAHDCLKDKDIERPSAHNLCERLADLKVKIKYIESDRSIEDKDEIIQSLTVYVKEKECMIASKSEEIQQLEKQVHGANMQLEEKEKQLQEQLGRLKQENNEITEALREKTRQLQESKKEHGQQLEANKQEIVRLEKQIAKLEHIVSSTENDNQRLREKERELTYTISKFEEKERQLMTVTHQKHRLEASEKARAQLEGEIAEHKLTVLSAEDKNCHLMMGQQLQQESDHDGAIGEEYQTNQQQKLLQQTNDGQVEEEGLQYLGQVNQRLTQAESGEEKEESELANQQLEAGEQERQVSDSEEHFQLCQRVSEEENPTANCDDIELMTSSIKLRWKEGKRAPCAMNRRCDVVVAENIIYIMDAESAKVYYFNFSDENWSQLPNCLIHHSSIAMINGLLTTVGGYSHSAYSDELLSLTGEGSARRWSNEFPSMPSKRMWTTIVCTGTVLIVAGGRGEDGVLSTVEVMDIEKHQWSIAIDLPEPVYQASATVCGDQLYMLGGADKSGNYTQSGYKCFINDLLQSYESNPLWLRFKGIYKANKVWRRLANLPCTHCTCDLFDNQLLAISGKDSGKPTTAIFIYDSTTNSWKLVGHMTIGRYNCFTAVLSDKLVVVGGITDGDAKTDTVEYACMHV